MDDYEKRIREKVFDAKVLTGGEWVYLVGVFQMAREYEELQHQMSAQPVLTQTNGERE